MQVVKYVARRMKEWKRTDVRGVSVINHQRNIPALDRENLNIFTNAQIEDAENYDLTLTTTWDLFLLFKGMKKWGWKSKYIRELLYAKGRLPRQPLNYKYAGKISKYWGNISVVGISVEQEKISKGDKIGYIIPDGYLEEVVKSLHVDKQDVDEALAGQLVSLKTVYSKDLLKKGIEVFIVID